MLMYTCDRVEFKYFVDENIKWNFSYSQKDNDALMVA